MTVKAWKIQTPRLRCPHCGKTVFLTSKARWSIHGVDKVGKIEDSPTPQKPSLYSPETEPDPTAEGDSDG